MSLTTLVRERLAPSWPAAREQFLPAAGQLGAGGANLFFAFLMVRVLAPGEYANLAAFLALYLLLHVFTGSLSAGSAIAPRVAIDARPRLWKLGFAASLVLVASNEPIAAISGIPSGLVLALALAAPAAGVLAVERGRLYGSGQHRRLVLSMAADPAVRLAIALPLAVAAGARGAGTGVAIGGWLALAVAAPEHLGRRWADLSRRILRMPDAQLVGSAPGAAAGDGASAAKLPLVQTRPAVITFLFFAVLMNQDLLWANRLLPPEEAGRFAVISTLGGVAAFATSTIPLVLLGSGERPQAFRTALLWCGALGGSALFVVGVAPGWFISVAFGSRYSVVGSTAVMYLLAMALLGIARVLAAKLCAGSNASTPAWIVGGIVAVHTVLIVLAPNSAPGIATATLITMAALTAILSAVVAVPRLISQEAPAPSVSPPTPLQTPAPAVEPPTQRTETLPPRWDQPSATPEERVVTSILVRARLMLSDAWRDNTVRAAALLTYIGLMIRLRASRSVWLDEAIAVSQARLPFHEMMTALRYGDVHPPLHSIALWLTTRVIGTSELAIRLPSMIAGALIIPVLYAMGRDLYGRRTGLVAAAFGTVAPFLVWYSQESRMYAFFMLFGLVAVWMQVRILKTNKRIDWAVFTAATALLLWTHYFALLQVLVQQLFFAAAAWRRWRDPRDDGTLAWRWLFSLLAIGLAILPLIPILRDQLIAYGNRRTNALTDVPARAGSDLDPGQQQMSIYALLANLVWAVWGYHSDDTMARIVALWPLGMLFMLFLLGRRRSWMSTVALASFVAPMLVLFSFGLFKRDLFELRYFVVAAPILVLLAARVVSAGFRRTVAQLMATTLISVTLLVGLWDQQTNGANPRIYDFRGALAKVSELTQPADVVLYSPGYLKPVVDYYAPDLPARALGDRIPDTRGRVIILASFLDKKSVSARVGGALGELRGERVRERRVEAARVKVWIFG